MGLTGYYHRFVHNYEIIATPLTQLTRKDGFKWAAATTQAFEALKRAMITIPTLALPDFTVSFVIETDASGTGLGSVLTQKQRPLVFFSQQLSPQARMKSVYERELMAIVLAIKKWHHYLLGHKFIVCTDQQALKHLLEQREIASQYKKWLTKILGYDFEIQYGTLNKAADALSRIPDQSELHSITVPTLVDVNLVQAEVQADPKLKSLIVQLERDPEEVPPYAMHQNQLFYKNRLVLSKRSVLIPLILHMFHDSVIGRHSGFLRTYKRLTGELFWHGMKRDTQNYVVKCPICQRNKADGLSPAGLLQPLPVPERIWEDLSMDFVDRLSKYSHFLLFKN